MENFIGQIIMMATNYVPNGYLPCDGRLVPIQQYAPLYSLLGTVYGGDGVTNFGLPNLVSNIPMHQKPSEPIERVMVSGHGEDISVNTTQVLYCICVHGLYPPRD